MKTLSQSFCFPGVLSCFPPLPPPRSPSEFAPGQEQLQVDFLFY